MAALAEVIEPSRALDGVISFDLGRDLADPDSFGGR
jgi:quinol monooxygenase YgiN